MTQNAPVLKGSAVFDGTRLRDGYGIRIANGLIQSIEPIDDARPHIDLGDDILAPGFVDLQVNGGGGVMFNDAPTVATLTTIAAAHRTLGTTTILPTLITDASEKTPAAISAVSDAIAQGVPGIAGLHLEGPHIDPRRKGAHDARFIRPMEDADLRLLIDAAARLPVLMVTLAPENATSDQIRALTDHGILVSLGHSEADFDTCRTAFDAGARAATHLFNAMSQMTARAPGLVGAALADGRVAAGLIADGHHVHTKTIRLAMAAKTGPGPVFLVSDAMAPAGSDIDRFDLNGRTVLRRAGRLTLEDGTLAGADLDLIQAVRVMVNDVGLPLADALAMATSLPAGVAGLAPAGSITGKAPASLIRIARDLSSATPVVFP